MPKDTEGMNFLSGLGFQHRPTHGPLGVWLSRIPVRLWAPPKPQMLSLYLPATHTTASPFCALLSAILKLALVGETRT